MTTMRPIRPGYLTALLFLTAGPALAAEPAISTPVQAVVDTYQGVTVTDPYRWLESGADPKVREWSLAQDQRTRRYLDGLPMRQPIYDRLMAQIGATSSSFSDLRLAGGKLFASYQQPPKQQTMIAVLPASADPAAKRVVVDPNEIDPAGQTAVDWFVPSPDGKLLAVSLSEKGSEDGTLHVFDVATGKETGEVISRIQYPTGGGSLAWREDSKGFWYTRYPGPERPADEQHFFQKLYFHKLGDKVDNDVLVLGQGLPKVAEIFLRGDQKHGVLVVAVANGDGGEFAHYVIDASNRVRQVTRFKDKVVAAAAGPDGNLYLVSRQNAPRGRLLKVSLRDPALKRARIIVKESDGVLLSDGEHNGNPVVITKRALYVRQLVGGPSRVAIFDHEGRPRGLLPLPDVASVHEIEDMTDGSLLFSVETYLQPPRFLRYDERSGQATDTALVQTSPVEFADIEVVREFAVSKDGTRVPLNIVRRKGAQVDGITPVLLTGYGGYGVSLTPRFLGPKTRLWLDAGGIFVIANLRGGGEYGEAWHQQGALTHKQNVFDDFTAAARTLIDRKYTDSGHLAIIGGSNGGLLVGAALIQHPELFQAVVAEVGLYDMLRVETEPNGVFNVTEFGTVANPEQFKALHAYSPYHHVVDGEHYPATFMATGENDGRVDPMHSRKMIARLQAAAGLDQPIYLSINDRAGHGIGSALSVRVGQLADVYGFLFDRLGMSFPGKN
jgi:prolyl oligopeptidase